MIIFLNFCRYQLLWTVNFEKLCRDKKSNKKKCKTIKVSVCWVRQEKNEICDCFESNTLQFQKLGVGVVIKEGVSDRQPKYQ